MKRHIVGILLAIACIFQIQTIHGQSKFGMQPCDTFDILFMIDHSNSFKGDESKLINPLFAYIDSLNIDSAVVKVGFIWFDCGSHLFHITGDRKDIEDELKYVKTLQASRGTLLGQAFKDAWNLFSISSNAREKCCNQSSVQRCIVVVSDGKVIDHDDYEAALQEAEAFKNLGGVIATIGVGNMNKSSANNLEQLATDGCFIKTDLKNLQKHLFELRLCRF